MKSKTVLATLVFFSRVGRGSPLDPEREFFHQPGVRVDDQPDEWDAQQQRRARQRDRAIRAARLDRAPHHLHRAHLWTARA
jgi:hypothetical protein